MCSAFFRRLILCLLLAAIPVQGMAAAAMPYCCDRAGAGEAMLMQDGSGHHEPGHHEQHATADDPDADGHHRAHADHDGDFDGNSQHARCSVCAAFCSGGVIVAGTSGFSAPLPCSSPRAAAPATHFSSFFPTLPERPPLTLL